jgi:hypothetical protein
MKLCELWSVPEMQARRFFICLTILLTMVGRVFAQAGAGGTILGTITDTVGNVVPNAAVDVTNVATNVVIHSRSTSSGDFTVPFLVSGTYRVTVLVPGFEKAEANGVTLVVGQQERVNLALKPGSVSETVQVQSNAATLDTDTAAVSQLVSQNQVENLPLNGRNFLQLLFIGAGAVTTGGEQGTSQQGHGAAISINGSRPESNTYLLDGMLNTDQSFNTPAVVLSVDAIQEFKVLSETYSAQYGFSSNQISIVSKSGTNQFHGSVFEFNRNDAFDAKSYFLGGQPKSELRQNQFGYVLGGPVDIPKLYNGKDKTFFLANYEGWRVISGNSGFANTPPPPLLSGLFAGAVTDPTTGKPFPGCISNGTAYASCIPQARFSRVAQVALSANYFPAPNCTPGSCQGNNYRVTQSLPAQTDQQTYRLDQNLGRWGRVFGRGSFTSSTYTGAGSASVNIGDTLATQQDTNWAVSHTIPINQHLINQFSFGRMEADTISSGQPAPASVVPQLGLTGIYSNLTPAARIYPYVSFLNDTGQANQISNFGGALNAYGSTVNPMWQFVETLTAIRGSHTFAMGGDYKRWELDRNASSNFLGYFIYSGFATGDQFADFLLGYYNEAQGSAPGPYSKPNVIGSPYQYNFQYFATFFQDDWKASQRVTLNLGLRWDLRAVPNETSNHFSWFDVTNPHGGVCMADKSVFSNGIAGDSGFYRYCGTRSPGTAEKKNFAPRIGVAWRPIGEKTVVRAGYAINWDGIEGREIDGSAGFYPYAVGLNLQQTAGQAGYQTTDSLFPPLSVGPVIPGPNGQNSFAVVVIPPKPFLHNPYVQQYTLSFQRELLKDTILEVNYVGNKGTHLLTRNQKNQAYPMTDPAFCAVAANQSMGDCPVLTRRPYSNFGTYIEDQFEGYSNYNAANVKLEHRGSDLALTAIYTWSKSLDDKSAAAGVGVSQYNGWQGYLNNHDPNKDYGRSDFDTGQRFVASALYNLPIGRGKTVLKEANKAVDTAVGGWQLSTIYTAQLGFPMSIIASDTSAGLLDTAGQNRTDLIGIPSEPKKKTQWFNTGAFSTPAPNVFGDSSRNVVRMPGINNFDVGLLKTFAFTERVGLQLRIESFNTFNHPQFNPDPSVPAFSGGASTVGNSIANPQTFGLITGAAPARIVQLGGKITF